MAGIRDVHVSKVKKRWRVTQNGRALSTHYTQTSAVRAGRAAARREHTELVTHGRDGRIRAKDSFGRESPHSDTER